MAATIPDYDKQLHWLALRMVPGLGARRSAQLIRTFDSPEAIFRASPAELEDAGAPAAVARSIASGCTFDEAVLQHEALLRCGAKLVALGEARYPRRLAEIHDPPPLLFARGRLELLDTVMIGVVGTRRPTPYGTAVAERLSADLARARLTVVSGMARGIDTSAHRGALEVGGNTIAVFGCGVDRVYPAENKKLAARIAEQGLILSEFPMGAPAHPQNFPIRNRIVSGIGVGVLVVEGAQYSGSAITARLAMEQGRDVFAVPGSITSKVSWGPNLLIKQGAKLVQGCSDIIEELSPSERRSLALEAPPENDSGTQEPVQASLPIGSAEKAAREIMKILRVDTALHVDEVLEKVENCSSSEIIAALFELEMLGAIRQLPGKNFVKVW